MKRNELNSLIERCINKEDAAWSAFVKHFTGLLRWAISDRLRKWQITFNNEDVEDIKQLTFSELWEKDKLREIRDIKKIEAWLAIVAGNCAISCMRGRRGQDIPYLEDTLEQAASAVSGYSSLEGNEIRGLINSFIDKLPEHVRTMLILHYFYNKKHKEIAGILKIPTNTVSTVVARAKISLRNELNSKGYKNF